MTKDSFIFYRSFYEAIVELDEHSRWLIIDAICRKALYDEETQFTGLLKMVYTLISPVLESNQKKSEGGKKGGRPQKNSLSNGDENPKTIGFENSKTEKNIGFEKSETEKTIGFENSETEKTIGFEKSENEKTIGFEIEKPIPSNDNSNEQEQEEEQEEEEEEEQDVDYDLEREEKSQTPAVADATTPTEKEFSGSIEQPASPEKEKSSAKKEKAEIPIEERARQFHDEVLQEFSGKYPNGMLEAFANYWSEYNAGGKKMRKEMEKVFDVGRRLAKWAENDKEWNKKNATTAAGNITAKAVNHYWGK